MRLQQYLAQAGVASRRKCEDIIRAGRVTVGGRIAMLGETVEAWDTIALDGQVLSQEAHAYFLFNKPMHVVTSMGDPRGRPCVGDYTKGIGARVFPVGRLDFDTEGLLLLTNDGALTQRLTHPSHGSDKRYVALVRGRPGDGAVAALLSGVMLDNPLEDRPAHAFYVKVEPAGVAASKVYITVREGRNRIVRRMLEAVGYPVLHLKRVGMGPLELGRLPAGAVRALTASEIKALESEGMSGDD